MQIVTTRLTLPPIDADHLSVMRDGRHQAHWAPDFPTAGDAMIAGLYERVGVPADEHARLFAHRLVIENETGLVVGGVGVKGPPRDGAVEIGYGIVPSRQRRGYATEAVTALIDALWDDAEVAVIEAQVDPANIASVRVLLRTGFRQIGSGDEYDDYRLARPASV